MHLSRKITKVISVAAFLGMLATSAMAGQNGSQSRDQDGTHSQDRIKKKTCALNTTGEMGALLIAKQNGSRDGGQDGTHSQDRDRDPSCQNA